MCRVFNSYREDGLQFLPVDLPVAVLIEQFEIPLEFLVDLSLQQQADGGDVLHKVDVPVLQTAAEASRWLAPSIVIIITSVSVGALQAFGCLRTSELLPPQSGLKNSLQQCPDSL